MSRGQCKTSLSVLIEAVQEGDKAAFEELYKMTHRDVFHYLYGFLKDRNAAEDVLVEVYIAVWRGASGYKGRAKVKTWIFGIARNLALNFFRNSPPTNPLESYPEVAAPGEPGTIADSRILVNEALGAISLQHREVLELVFMYGMNYKEIACLLKVPVNTVKTRVFHAKKAVGEYIEGKRKKKGGRRREDPGAQGDHPFVSQWRPESKRISRD